MTYRGYLQDNKHSYCLIRRCDFIDEHRVGFVVATRGEEGRWEEEEWGGGYVGRRKSGEEEE